MKQQHLEIITGKLAQQANRELDEILRVFELLCTERDKEPKGSTRYRNLTIAMREQISRLYTLHLAHFGPQCACDKHF